MNEKITIVWQIMTLGGVLISVIYVLGRAQKGGC